MLMLVFRTDYLKRAGPVTQRSVGSAATNYMGTYLEVALFAAL